ncbi:MAG: glucans biosynthesis glucosyltransferase MdoH [Rhizobiaceae bacterium]
MNIHNLEHLKSTPSPAPLPMPTQDLTRPFNDPEAPGVKAIKNTHLFRWAIFIPALLTTLALITVFSEWFQKDGFATTELIMLALVGFSTFWISLSVATSLIGLLFARRPKTAPKASKQKALSVALLVPIYNEDPASVFNRLKVIRDDIAARKDNHKYCIFILSDTRDEHIALEENRSFNLLRRTHFGHPPVYYRRRLQNTDRKTGNIRNWIETWGADWHAFITLDADSLMDASTISCLADEMAENDELALVQTVPHLLGANTLFSRVQQFANNIYGGVLAHGLDRLSGNEGNYWGHNAIVRTRAFASCAGLPTLSGKGALSGTIKSHDFVEAALLRRAGWAVRLLPSLKESYEETPQNIIDYVLRDRRWCQGNLQHIRLLGTKGLATTSRFHMLQGATAYLSSVVWFLLLILWAVMGRSEEKNVFRYFTDSNPLFPQWPQMDTVSRLVILGFILGLLLLPKIFAVVANLWRDPSCSKLGGRTRFLVSACVEILLSFLLAPILMVQHVTAVLRTLIGLDAGWEPQNRSGSTYTWLTLARFHWLETLSGLLLVMGIFAEIITLWLVPIAASLVLAIPISFFFGKYLSPISFFNKIISTQEELFPSQIIIRANKKAFAIDAKASNGDLSPLGSQAKPLIN